MRNNIGKVEKLLRAVYGTGQNVVLLGSVGVGKTEGVEDFAREVAKSLGRKFVAYDGREETAKEILASPQSCFPFVAFTITHIEPTDLIGVPRDAGDYLRYKMLEYAELLEKCGAGVLFIDEITNAQRLDQMSAVLRLFGERTLGFVKLPPTVMVIGAGNQPSQSVLAQELPEPLRAGKVMLIEVEPPSLEEWAEYMNEKYKDEWDRRVYLYLKTYGGFMESEGEKKEATENKPILCPRTWTKVALLSHKLGKAELEMFLKSYLGGKATELMAFLNTKIIPLREIEEKPEMWNQLDLPSKYFVVLEATKSMPSKYPNFFKKISSEDREIFELYIVLLPKEKKTSVITDLKKNLPQVFQNLVNLSVESVKFMGVGE